MEEDKKTTSIPSEKSDSGDEIMERTSKETVVVVKEPVVASDTQIISVVVTKKSKTSSKLVPFEIEKRYGTTIQYLGSGAYGIVVAAQDTTYSDSASAAVAIKKIAHVKESEVLARRVLTELILLHTFRGHDNIVDLKHLMCPSRVDADDVYIVTNRMDCTLGTILSSSQKLTDQHCRFFMYQVFRGLKYIHSIDVAHRDLKPDNLLVNAQCDLRISDFGLAALEATMTKKSNYVATRWYRSPEVLLGSKHCGKTLDMWSAACIMGEILLRRAVFPGRDPKHQLELVLEVVGVPSDEEIDRVLDSNKARAYLKAFPKKAPVPITTLFPTADFVACDLLARLFTFDPKQRLTVTQALEHPYFIDMHLSGDEPVCRRFDPSEWFWDEMSSSVLSKHDIFELIRSKIAEYNKHDLL